MPSQKVILLTGSTGFVGSAFLDSFQKISEYCLLSVVRTTRDLDSAQTESVVVGSINGSTDYSAAVTGVDIVVHAAARAHIMHDDLADPLAEYRKVNVDGTLNLARQAVAAGVRRFIFISSIKVNGEGTTANQPYKADDDSAPLDPYGVSKMEAEQGLRALAAKTGMEVVIIRPVLVYGPGVKANFLSMMSWLHKDVPLPFGAIHNRRSLVALDNLVDLIVTCIEHPAAANQTFLVSDGEDVSTTELLRRMGVALGKPARLLPVPSWVLEAGAAMLGKQALAQRLCGSLQVDISKTRELLNWTPPVSVDEALRKTAKHFLEQHAK
ncbi:SDR family oxidoreductase [Pseudomonas sp. MIL19]|uniref:UDP-glucose 4-epimerase family protein n=1 Tax=Pseudomonas sp. MIL19 TaxID=2976979 RepID=UPI002363D2CB|nr:SDR family oxidoreductase [Pseudomonas sp. MIL19]MDD2162450.1 SDR family oxidoreductase [Pseudomonas sp. MIL19]